VKTIFLLINLVVVAALADNSTKVISFKDAETSHEIYLKVFFVKDTNWNEANIISEINLANSVFLQCDLSITEVSLQEIDLSKDRTLNSRKILKDLINSDFRKPMELTLLLGSRRTIDPDITRGHAWGQKLMKTYDPETERIYENAALVQDQILFQLHEGVSTFAHELGHLLLNDTHVKFVNLMNGNWYSQDNSLTREQCRRMRNSPLVKKPADQRLNIRI
jgi:hypothetical protein